jgi:hypothetical protein
MSELKLVVDSCRSLLEEDSFWLLAGLTDNSYEEGSAPHFQKCVKAYEDVGAQPGLIQQLSAGINDNLLKNFRSLPQVVGAIRRNKAAGKGGRLRPDFEFSTDQAEILVECKMLYDCTGDKYYESTASDYQKLASYSSPRSRLFQVVFFVQLPGYDYPPGTWFDNRRPHGSRAVMLRGIDAQYARLRRSLPQSPAWPGPEPFKRALHFPTSEVNVDFLQRWYTHSFRPESERDNTWRFDSGAHLQDSAVGLAIWERSRIENGTGG